MSTGTDLAVLHVVNPSPTQQVLQLGSVGQARVGEEVIAVGSALGVLSNTVTRGIVSAVRQVGQVTLIQTDAAINPGNSGGPLISRSGLVIGINSLRVAQQTAEGVAFAVAIDHATQLLNGQRASDAQTPLNSLTQMLGGRSDTEDRRARGEQDYVRVLEWAGKNAAELDAYWEPLRRDVRRDSQVLRRSRLVRGVRQRRRDAGQQRHGELRIVARCRPRERGPHPGRGGKGRRSRAPARRVSRHRRVTCAAGIVCSGVAGIGSRSLR